MSRALRRFSREIFITGRKKQIELYRQLNQFERDEAISRGFPLKCVYVLSTRRLEMKAKLTVAHVTKY